MSGSSRVTASPAPAVERQLAPVPGAGTGQPRCPHRAYRRALARAWSARAVVDCTRRRAMPALRLATAGCTCSDYDEELGEDALRCLSLDDGREIWRRAYRVRVKRNHGMSRTVPALADGVVVTVGPRCHVMAVNAISGELLWGLDLERAYGSETPFWYTGQCPLNRKRHGGARARRSRGADDGGRRSERRSVVDDPEPRRMVDVAHVGDADDPRRPAAVGVQRGRRHGWPSLPTVRTPVRFSGRASSGATRCSRRRR